MEKADDDESDRSEDSIDECDDRLRFEDESESDSDLLCYDSPLIVEEREITSLDLLEEERYLPTLDDEYIGEDERHQELGEDYAGIGDISECGLSECFEIGLVDEVPCKLIEPQIESSRILDTLDEILYLMSRIGCILQKRPNFKSDFRKDIREDEYHQSDKKNIQYRHHMIGGRVFGCNLVRCITFSGTPPCMDFVCQYLTELQKYIGKEESDEKEGKEIPEQPSDKYEDDECYYLLNDSGREYNGKEPWDRYHMRVVKILFRL